MLFAIIGGGGLLRSVNGMMLAGGDPAYEEYVKAAGIDGKKDWQNKLKREHLYDTHTRALAQAHAQTLTFHLSHARIQASSFPRYHR